MRGSLPPVRLVELVAVMAMATDVGLGLPIEHAIRSCLLAMRLGARVGMSGSLLADLYYLTLLRMLGCTVARSIPRTSLPTSAMRSSSPGTPSISITATGRRSGRRSGRPSPSTSRPGRAAIIESGDRIAIEGAYGGTHTGPLVTPQGEIPATGRRFSLPMCLVMEVKAGRISSHRAYYDTAALAAQLGLAPAPDATAVA